MNLPEPYASAPTPRTDVKIVKFTAISNRQGLARREYEGAEIDYVSPESMRQLERELLYANEVMDKLYEMTEHTQRCMEDRDFCNKCTCGLDEALTAYTNYKSQQKE